MKTNLHIVTSRHPLVAGAVLLAIATISGWIGASGFAAAAAGSLDGRFGHHGKVLKNLGTDDEATAVAAQGGRSVAVGDVEVNGHDQMIVSVYRPDGRLDRDFARRGSRLVRTAGDGYARDIAIQANGRIVIAFISDPPGAYPSFGVARISPKGRLDKSFDHDGIQTTGFGTDYYASYSEGLALQPDGRIVVAGLAVTHRGYYDVAIARYTQDGELDDSFSGDGRQTTDVSGEDDEAESVAVDASGRIVIAGTTQLPEPSYARRLLVARYDSAGLLDPTFGGGGVVTSDSAASAEDVVALANGRVVAVGSADGDFLAARFTETGLPDGSFSSDGVQAIDFSDGTDVASSIASSGEKLVVAGTAETRRRATDFAAARLNGDGSLDGSFSKGGLRTVDVSGNDRAFDMSVDPRGRVLLAGSTTHRGGGEDSTDTALVRLR